MSDKKIVVAMILCFFFGIFGAHRFYVGKTASAIVQLLTLGGLGIWALIDLILILFREFSDGDGVKLSKWA
jgi:TM2 domain-containing membrane protein YozV